MSEEANPTPEAPAKPGRLARFGWRNVAYLGFVVLLIPFGIALEASGPGGPDRGGGVAAAVMLWAIVSVLFFLVNAVLAIVAFAKGKPFDHALLACALPFGLVLLVMLSSVFIPY